MKRTHLAAAVALLAACALPGRAAGPDVPAGKAMDKLLAALEPQRKKWHKAATTQPGKAADRTYWRALRTRVLLGGVFPDGKRNEQFERLYESPQLKKVKLRVWARTEGRILKVKDQACYVEVPAARVLGKVAAKEPAGGWLSLARKRSVFDVIGVLLANRKRSGVTVNLHCKDKRIVSGNPIEVSAAFRNTSNAIKTVHFGPVYLRDSATAAPLSGLGGPGSQRIRAIIRNIAPGKTITITTKLLPKLPPAAIGGPYRLYAIYSLREGPNGPMPVRMVSDPVPVSISVPAAPPKADAVGNDLPPPKGLRDVGDFIAALTSRIPKGWELNQVEHGLTYPADGLAGRGFHIIIYDTKAPVKDGKRNPWTDVHIWMMGRDFKAKGPFRRDNRPTDEIARWRGWRVFLHGGKERWPRRRDDVLAAMKVADTDKPRGRAAAIQQQFQALARFTEALGPKVHPKWHCRVFRNSRHLLGPVGGPVGRGLYLLLAQRTKKGERNGPSYPCGEARLWLMDPSFKGQLPNRFVPHELGRWHGGRAFVLGYVRGTGNWHTWQRDLQAAMLASDAPKRSPTTRPATKPLDLDKTAKMLTKAAGGTWRAKTKALYGTIPIPKNEVFDTLCVVFPFPYDEAGKAKVLSFMAPRARGFRVLGSTEQCTVLVDRNLPDPPEKAAAFFAAVSKALKLRLATEPLDLDKTAKMLTKAAGGNWRMKTDNRGVTLEGTVPWGGGKFHTLCVVFPFRYDEAGKAKVLSYTENRMRPFRLLGSSDRCTVLADRYLRDPPDPKAAAFAAAVSKALKLRPSKATLTALRRARQLKVDIRDFVLEVWYYGPKDKGYHRLYLTVPTTLRTERRFEMIRFLDARQAGKIIDHLAAEGFLNRAAEVGEKANVVYKGPAYFMTVPRGAKRLEATLGWGPEMLARLDALRKVLDGEAGKAMDTFLKALEPQRKKWQARTQHDVKRREACLAALREIQKGFVAIARKYPKGLGHLGPGELDEKKLFLRFPAKYLPKATPAMRATGSRTVGRPLRPQDCGMSFRFAVPMSLEANAGQWLHVNVGLMYWWMWPNRGVSTEAYNAVQALVRRAVVPLDALEDAAVAAPRGKDSYVLRGRPGVKLTIRLSPKRSDLGTVVDLYVTNQTKGVVALYPAFVQTIRDGRPWHHHAHSSLWLGAGLGLGGRKDPFTYIEPGRSVKIKSWIVALSPGKHTARIAVGHLRDYWVDVRPSFADGPPANHKVPTAWTGVLVSNELTVQVPAPAPRPAVKWGKPVNGLVCGISGFKKNVELGVPCEIEVSIKNTSKGDILLLKRRLFGKEPLHDRVYFMQAGTTHREFFTLDKKKFAVGAVRRQDFVLLRPGDIYTFTHGTLVYTSSTRKNLKNIEVGLGLVGLTREGTYQMQVRYQPWFTLAKGVDLGGLKPWQGVLLSAPVEVVVEKAPANGKPS